MDSKENIICKICSSDIKFSDKQLEVIDPCASIQAINRDDTHKQICCTCVEQSKVKIKAECDEIQIEESIIINMGNFEQVHVKEEAEEIETRNDTMPISFTEVKFNCDNVKIEYDNFSSEDPLQEDYTGEICDENIHLLKESTPPIEAQKPCKSNISDKRFTDMSKLTVHKQIHLSQGEKSYKCDVCHKDFNTSKYLRRHQRTHVGEKPYKCDICGMQFSQGFSFKRHKQIHTPSRKKAYKCDICKKEYFTLGDLKVHQRIHTGEKPFKCDICDKEFSRTYDFNQHKQIHVPSREKTYKCDVCQKYYYTLTLLKTHTRRTHIGRKLSNVTYAINDLPKGEI